MGTPCSTPKCDREAKGCGLCHACYQRRRYQGTLPELPKQEKSCGWCRKLFTARRWNAEANYCSKPCMDHAKYDRKRTAAIEERAEAGTLAEDCRHCGEALPGDKRYDAVFCSDECGLGYRNELRSRENLAAKAASGRTCKGCAEPIDPTTKSNALYCSLECKIRSRRHEAYGLTKAELDVMLAQHEVCAICKSGDWGAKGPQVDHDHATGKVRGILCGNCNQGLGRFRDDPAVLRAATAYLEHHAARAGHTMEV